MIDQYQPDLIYFDNKLNMIDSSYRLDFLVDVVSKNGCVLLNVTPNAEGEIPDLKHAISFGIETRYPGSVVL